MEMENKNEKREEKQTFEMQRVRNKDKEKSFKTFYNKDGERREGQKESENLKDKEERWRRKAQRNKKI